jgi:hypothetical protein
LITLYILFVITVFYLVSSEQRQETIDPFPGKFSKNKSKTGKLESNLTISKRALSPYLWRFYHTAPHPTFPTCSLSLIGERKKKYRSAHRHPLSQCIMNETVTRKRCLL